MKKALYHSPFREGKGRIARGTTFDSARRPAISRAFNAGLRKEATQESCWMAFSHPTVSLHLSGSEATFRHPLPGPPFSRWTALSADSYDVLLSLMTICLVMDLFIKYIGFDWFCQAVFPLYDSCITMYAAVWQFLPMILLSIGKRYHTPSPNIPV